MHCQTDFRVQPGFCYLLAKTLGKLPSLSLDFLIAI